MHREDRETEHLRRLLDHYGDRRPKIHRHFLREWRIYRGITQDELASYLDTSTGLVKAWEAGDRGIRLKDQSSFRGAADQAGSVLPKAVVGSLGVPPGAQASPCRLLPII
jgi:hypothetical protein